MSFVVCYFILQSILLRDKIEEVIGEARSSREIKNILVVKPEGKRLLEKIIYGWQY